MGQAAKVYDWQKNIPKNADKDALFDLFKSKAEALTAKVIRCTTAEEAEKAISKEIIENGYKRVVSVPLTKVNINNISNELQGKNVELATELNRDIVEQAELGITEFDLGIAELGTLVKDASDVYKRLVSMLPPTHLAIVNTNSLVSTFEETLEVIQKIYGNEMPSYITFVTGPSKTADIERVLTIGVHGPGRLIIVCVD